MAVATQPFIVNTTSPSNAQASLTFVTGTHALKVGFNDTWGGRFATYDSPAEVGVTYGYLAMMVMNGSNLAPSSPFFRDYALLKVMRVSGPKLTPIAESRIGHWCEGVAWSRNQRTILVQCMNEKEIAVFGFDGKALKPQSVIKVSGGPAGLRTAERP